MAGTSGSTMRSHAPDFGGACWDLAIVATVLATLGVATVLNAPPIVRAPLSVVAVFFVPGYALTAALFPVTDSSTGSSLAAFGRQDGITPLDRGVLSVGTSLGLVVLLGVAIDASPARISAESQLAGIALLTAVAIPLAIYRRRRATADRPPRMADDRTGDSRSATGRLDLPRIAIALSLLFAVGAVAVSVSAVETDGGVTEFYFQNDTEEAADATAYPTNLTRDRAATMPLAVGNREGRSITYAVVGQLQRADRVDGGVVVRDRRSIDTWEVTVSDGQTHAFDTSVTPRDTGRYRLTYLLYLEDVPDRPRTDTAYREIHLWIDVGETTERTPSV